MRPSFHDFRQAFSLLSRDGRFTAFSVLLLAAGVGAAGSLFSLHDALLVRPLPIDNPGSLIRLVLNKPRFGPRSDFRPSVARSLLEHSQSLESISVSNQSNAAYRDEDRSDRIRLEIVSPSYFSLFEAHPVLGRGLQPADDANGVSALPAVLSHAFWLRRYQSRADILGRSILVNGKHFVIAGVANSEFHGPYVETTADLWVPNRAVDVLFPDPQTRANNLFYDIFARLRRGVSPLHARAETESHFRAAVEQDLSGMAQVSPGLRNWELDGTFLLDPIPQGVSRFRTQFGPALQFIFAAGVLLFILAIASVAGLMLARSAARRPEFAARIALGASPMHLVRLAVFEALLLSGAGTASGLLLTAALTPALVHLLPPVRLIDTTTVPFALNVQPDARLLVFLVVATFLASTLIALAPALQAFHVDPAMVLRTVRSSSRTRGRSVLVVLQIAICTALLVAAGQFTLTLYNLRESDPGFDGRHIVSFTVDPALDANNRDLPRSMDSWKEAIKALPGVRTASFSMRPLFHGIGVKMTVSRVGRRAASTDYLNASIHAVTAEYFDTMSIGFLAGRNFPIAVPPRTPNLPESVIVNQAFADRFFSGETALGQLFGDGTGHEAKPQFQIVGVVANAKYRSLREQMPPTVYRHIRSANVLHVATLGAPLSVVAPVREALRQIAPELPIHEVATINQDIEASLASERMVAWIAGAFGAIALSIVSAGLFGLLSYVVTQRTREIGIRIAVGARPADIFQLISSETLRLTGAGLTGGLTIAWFASETLAALLFGVSPREPFIWTASAVFILVASLLSASVPALRAVRVDPTAALRDDT